MEKYISARILPILIFTAMAIIPAHAQETAPAKIQATLFYKLLSFYTNLGNDSFALHVVGAPDVHQELKKLEGMKVGKAILGQVTSSDELPSNGAKVVYVGKNVPQITEFTQANKVLSITGTPEYVEAGVTLGIGVIDEKARIILNLTSTKKEGVVWNPAILKVSTKVQ